MQHDDSLFTRNETLRTINDRRSVRTFTQDEVTEEEISVLLHAANAGSVGTQPAGVEVHHPAG